MNGYSDCETEGNKEGNDTCNEISNSKKSLICLCMLVHCCSGICNAYAHTRIEK